MRFFSILRVEAGRLAKNPLTWLCAALTAAAPLVGYSLYTHTIGDSMAALYLANPMLAGGLCGAVMFALLTLQSLDKPRRSGAFVLTDTVISPIPMHIARLIAVLAAATVTAVAIGLIYLPYTAYRLDIVFSMADYWLAVFLFLFSGPVMGSIAAAAVWQVVGRLDVSAAVVLVCLIFSRGRWCRDYFLAQWSVPLVPTLSDAFGSAIVWRTALYSRVLWLCVLLGLWLMSLLCVRQYGKGAAGSFVRHARKIALPICSIVLLCGGAFMWRAQPFVDHSPVNYSEMMDSQPNRWSELLVTEAVSLSVEVESYTLGTLSGIGTYRIRNSSGREQELYFELNPGYRVRSVTANGESIGFEDMKNDFISSREVRCVLPADESTELVISYGGMPRVWNAQESTLSGSFISRSGLSLSAYDLAPTVRGCADVWDDTAAFSMQIKLPKNFTPVSDASVQQRTENADGSETWTFEKEGTDRMRLFAGDYIMEELEAGENAEPIEFYYSRKYQPRLEGEAISLMEKAVAYCTETYGPRSQDRNGSFKIVQLTAFEFGGFASGNISGMGETYFSDVNLADREKGAGAADVLAHEIVHQWWGLSAMFSDDEDEHWTDEGITTYTTYRLMAKIMGEEYAQKNYIEKWEATMADQSASFYRRNPQYLSRLPERYLGDINSSYSSTNMYDGTALMIYRAEQKLGREALDDVLARLFTEGGTEMPPYISQGDFLAACGLSEGDIARE